MSKNIKNLIKSINSKLTIEERDYLNGRLFSNKNEIAKLKNQLSKLESQLRKSQRRLTIVDNKITITDTFTNPDSQKSVRLPLHTIIEFEESSSSAAYLESLQIVMKMFYSNNWEKKIPVMELDSEGRKTTTQARDKDGNLKFNPSLQDTLIEKLELLKLKTK